MSEQFKIAGWVRILSIIIPYLLVVGIFQLIGAALVDFDYGNLNVSKTSEQKLIIQFFSFLGTSLVVFIFVKYIDKEKIIDIGFQTRNRINEFWTGLLVGFVIMLLAFGLLEIIDEIQFQEIIFKPKEIILSILLFILVSFTEEILLRGYVLRNLMYSFNKYIALIISAILFSLMHAWNPNIDTIGFSNIFLAGILLGITYIHTKNLWFPIALHFSWNFFQTIFGFNVSGQNTYSAIKFSMDENTLLNGGSFGFEGSILSLIAIIITIVAITKHYRSKKLIPKRIYKTNV
ncbi:CPBP family intramembrane metalloprotease [Salegentibacter sp. LM13S]|uniref:CPBP family intramembrane glutamic endopeptidase n=1 Tax=Salegentibacter lacus TaxID=2873599 RepID=UPI001CCCAB14|nr:type II CAAX endopeptidase family protein [Salegentibacter lacus]MBZ9629749.1 CPBP family intramembrane metalloprotease [Salegentibacter lacus]